MKFTNNYNQCIGEPIPNWQPARYPDTKLINGTYCRLEKLNIQLHARDLFETNTNDMIWTYLPYGPFLDFQKYEDWLRDISIKNDPYFFSIINLETNKAQGIAALMNIKTDIGSIEVGHLNYSPLLQKNPAATEAMFLLMKYSFDLGYRRYEWKCDHLNGPSRKAAMRLGFQFEGTFRQATVYKGRSRDTDWFSIIDKEWPVIKIAFEAWLNPQNFDSNKIQVKGLSEIINLNR